MNKKIYTAICFFPIEQNRRPHKYKNVSTPARLCIYMKRKGAEYINFYDAKTQSYEFRLYTNPEYLWKRNNEAQEREKQKTLTLIEPVGKPVELTPDDLKTIAAQKD